MVRLSLLALLGVAAAMPGTAPAGRSGVPAGSHKAPVGKPMPNITEIMSKPQSSFKSYKTGGLHRQPISADKHHQKRDGTADGWRCDDHRQPILTWGDNDDGGRGVTITNAGNDWRGFYIYHNTCDSIPWKYIWIEAGKTQFVSFPDKFEGRIVRGVDSAMLNGQAQPLGSWLEVGWDKNDIGWADVSLIRGCDGAILTWDLGNGDAWKGFTQWVLDGAPGNSYAQKTDGQWVLKYTENWDGSINTDPRDWELQKIGEQYVYVDDYHGNPVISSPSRRFGSYWPEGRA